MTAVDLELTLRAAGAPYEATLWCAPTPRSAPIDTTRTPAPVVIDQARLLALALDPAAYGLELGKMLLADPSLAQIFAQAHAVAQQQGSPLRLRLTLAPNAAALHTLRWETLRDPAHPDSPLLTTGAQVLFSRYLSSDDWTAVEPRLLGKRRALVLIACPPDLPQYGPSRFDVASERTLIEQSLAPIPTTVLATGQATLNTLAAHLHDGYDILYLLAHGRLDEQGETWVYLEGENGLTEPVCGKDLATRIAELSRRPQLIVLGTCESAGDGSGPALIALGPQLAQKGVPAVLAMQGKISLNTLRHFLPSCFQSIHANRPIDQAVAIARGTVRERADFWVPVLFLRLPHGELWTVPREERRAPRGAPFFAPFQRPSDPLVGRAALLSLLQARLCTDTPVRLGLDGMPGVGKTRLALELAYAAPIREHFQGGVLMTSLGQQPDRESALRRWYEAAGVHYDPRQRLSEQAERLAAALNHSGLPVLLIIDDLWTLEDAQALLLAGPLISAVLTSRQRDQLDRPIDLSPLIAPADRLPLSPLEQADAAALLRQRAGLPTTGHEQDLTTLAELVGGLPLLLAPMGAYLGAHHQGQQTGWFDAALEELHQAAVRLNLPAAPLQQARARQKSGLLTWLRRPAPQQPLSAKAVIALSVDALTRADQQFFVRLAALPSDPISFGADAVREVAEQNHPDPTLQRLVQRNLLQEVGDRRFCLHRALWEWAEQRAYQEVRSARRRLADWHARIASPEGAEDFVVWQTHADNWQQMLQTWEDALEDPQALQSCLGTIVPLLVEYAYWNALLPGLEQARTRFQRGDTNLITLIQHWLSRLYHRLAKYESARFAAEAALQGFYTTQNYDGQALTKVILGHIDNDLGNYKAAFQWFTEALMLIPETDRPEYAACLGGLAKVLRELGDYTAARPLYERILTISEQVFGSNHSHVATSLNNLALLLHEQGDDSTARPLFERALAISEQVFGPDHLQVAPILHNLAILLHCQGEYATARIMAERALVLREQWLPIDHPHVARSLDTLAGFLHEEEEDAMALPLTERALAIAEQCLGPDHPDTQKYRANLETIRQAMNPKPPPTS